MVCRTFLLQLNGIWQRTAAASALLDDATGEPFAGISCGLAAVIIRIGMDHQGSATNAILLAIEGHHAVEDLGAQHPILADILIGHVTSMRSLGRKQSVFGI